MCRKKDGRFNRAQLRSLGIASAQGAGPRAFFSWFFLLLLGFATACQRVPTHPGPEAEREGKRTVLDHLKRPVTVVPDPARIVSLAPSVTEILLSLGLEARLVGVTNFCNLPETTPPKTRIGDLQNPNLERIVLLKPDLAIATTSGNIKESIEKLASLGIPVYTLNARTMEETLQSILDTGDITGRSPAAQAVVTDIRRRLAAVRQRAQAHPPKRVLYLIWHDPIVAPGGDSFINDALRWAGGLSVTADATERSPRYSLEQIIAKRPDYIFVPRQENPVTLDYFVQSPGWSALPAVQARRLFFINPAIQHPSPHLIEGIEEVATILSRQP